MKTVKEYMKLITMQSKENEVNPEIFHNTELMLSLYRKVLKRVNLKLNYIGINTYENDNRKIYEIVDSMFIIDDTYKIAKLNERLMSIEESKSILALMDKALSMLKYDGETGEIQYQILYNCFFNKDKIKNEAIMEKLSMSYSTYYRYKNKAIKSFAVNLWGYILPEFIMDSETKTALI